MTAATIKVTATVGAWLPSYTSPDDLLTALRAGKNDEAARLMHFSPADMTSSGWTRVGDAHVTVELLPHDEQVAKAVASLRQMLEAERIESQRRQMAILDRISKLQALTFDAEVSS
jgi:hypothetical protein